MAESKPHNDSIFHHSSSTTISTMPASDPSANATVIPTIVESSILTTVTPSNFVESTVSENTSGTLKPATSDANEYETALQNLRRRRLELKQQREQSSRKADTVCSPTSASVETETITVPLSSRISDQPSVLVQPHYSDRTSSNHNIIDEDSLQSRPVDSNVSAHILQPMMSSSIPSKPTVSIHSELSSARMKLVSPQAPVSTSSSESSTSPGKTGFSQYSYKLEKFREHLHRQGKTDSEVDANPDYLLMKEEERWKPQPVSTDYSHMDIPPNPEQKFDRKESKKHKEHADESEQENLIRYYEFENRDMVTAGDSVRHIQDGGKQQQMLITNTVSMPISRMGRFQMGCLQHVI